MTWVHIPFTPGNTDLILLGLKSCTSRQRPKAKTGDFFKVGERTYVITRVESHTLGWVADNLHREEGYPTREAFIECWNDIARSMAAQWGEQSKFPFFEENIQVWTHFFIPLEEWERVRPMWF